MTFSVRFHGLSDVGKERDTNQDHFLLARLKKELVVEQTSLPDHEQSQHEGDLEGHLLLVADGMGGYAGGELASRIAIDSAALYVLNTVPWFYRQKDDCIDEFQAALKESLEFAQKQLAAEARNRPFERDMGTTLTMAYIVGKQLFVVHIGDTRCYLSRGDRLHQITHDHTVAQKLVEEGMMSPETAETSPMSHVLWNAIGAGDRSSHNPDVYKAAITAGDFVLVCSDGLTKHVTDEQLLQVISGGDSLEEKCATLVDMANEAGGTDNITVALAAIEGDPGTLPELRHETWHGKAIPVEKKSTLQFADPASTEIQARETLPLGEEPRKTPPPEVK